MLRTPELQRVCLFLLLSLLRSRGRETRARGDASNLQGAPTELPPDLSLVRSSGSGRRAAGGGRACTFVPFPLRFSFFSSKFPSSLPFVSFRPFLFRCHGKKAPPLLPPPPFPPSDADERRKTSRKKRKLDRSHWRKDFQLCTFRSQLCESPHGLSKMILIFKKSKAIFFFLLSNA